MKLIKVFLLVVSGITTGLFSMEEPDTSYRPISSISDTNVTEICFANPSLFAIATHLSSQISFYELRSKKTHSLIKCDGAVHSMSQCDAFKKMVVACFDNICIYDTQTGQQVRKYKTNSHKVNSVHAHPSTSNIVLSGSVDSTVKVWDLRSPTPVFKQAQHTDDAVNIVRVCADGIHCVSCSADKTTKIWDLSTTAKEPLQTMQVLHTIKNVVPLDVAYNAAGDKFMLCANYVNRYDSKTATLLATFNRTGKQEPSKGSKIVPTSSLIHACASVGLDENELVALGTDEGRVVFFNPENAKIPPITVTAFQNPVNTLAFCPNGNCLIAGSILDQKLQVYELSNKKESPILQKRRSLKGGCLP